MNSTRNPYAQTAHSAVATPVSFSDGTVVAAGPSRAARPALHRRPRSGQLIGVIGLRLAAARRPRVRTRALTGRALALRRPCCRCSWLWLSATIADAGLDAKAVAMLGVLAAVGAALRPLGAGTAGMEPMFFLMVLSGRVLGPGFGFVLGSVTMFASALLTGGVGPWMPFQMLAMGWFTMGAGLLPGPDRLRGRGELADARRCTGPSPPFAYGTVMNLQGWTYLGGLSSGVVLRPGRPGGREPGAFPRVLPGHLPRLGPGPGRTHGRPDADARSHVAEGAAPRDETGGFRGGGGL